MAQEAGDKDFARTDRWAVSIEMIPTSKPKRTRRLVQGSFGRAIGRYVDHSV